MYPHVADVAVSVRSGGGGNQLDRQTIRQMGRTKNEDEEMEEKVHYIRYYSEGNQYYRQTDQEKQERGK